jgi:hypothetical protein
VAGDWVGRSLVIGHRYKTIVHVLEMRPSPYSLKGRQSNA